MRFFFGQCNKEVIFAPNIEVAKKMFMASVLYPENLLDDTQCLVYGEYDSTSKVYLGRKAKPDACIPIFSDDAQVGSILVKECLEFSYDELQATSTRLLQGPETPQNAEGTLPVIGSPSLLALDNKATLRAKNELIASKLNELEETRRSLQKAVEAIRKEMRAKCRIIAMVETFLGVQEEVHLLRDGMPAPEEEPLYIFQQKLYMDEEMGIYSNGGIGFEDIGQFDEWVIENLETFLHKPKAVCAWQIRRNAKNYTNDTLVNAFMNDQNWNTYWLIRNGERVYRIWSDIRIPNLVYPTEQELNSLLAKYGMYDGDYLKNKVENWQDTYVYGMLSLQGMIERTDILGTSLRGVVNFAKPHGIPPNRVVLVRDAEPGQFIGDGKPSWDAFCDANQKAIGVGTRVLLKENIYGNNNNWRTHPFNASPPKLNEVHTIEAVFNNRDAFDRENNTLLFRYMPEEEEEVYRPREYGDNRWSQRKRRVPYRVYRGEIFNVDDITLDEIEYYLHNRLYRENYLEMLPVLHRARAFKKQEAALEEEFVKLLASRLGWDEGRYDEIREAIKWWKLKNKWKRAVTKDEPKAMRMILRRLQRRGHDEDHIQ